MISAVQETTIYVTRSLHVFWNSLRITEQNAEKNQNDYEKATDVTDYFSGTDAFNAICVMCAWIGLNNLTTPS